MIKAFKAAMASRTPEQEILFNRLVMGVISIVAFPASGLDINLVYCCAIFLACNTILYFLTYYYIICKLIKCRACRADRESGRLKELLLRDSEKITVDRSI